MTITFEEKVELIGKYKDKNEKFELVYKYGKNIDSPKLNDEQKEKARKNVEVAYNAIKQIEDNKAKKTATAKSGAKKKTMLGLASEIKKRDNVSWDEAKKRAKSEYESEKKKAISEEKQKVSEFKKQVGKIKFTRATTKTDIKKDKVLPALPSGKRYPKRGTTTNNYGTFKNNPKKPYWENRANRMDVNQPSKSVYPKLADGGNIDNKTRFDVDFYDDNNTRSETSVELILRGSSLENVIKDAIKKAYELKKNYIEFYNRNSFLGSVNLAISSDFREGKDYRESKIKLADGGEIGSGKNGYVAFYKGKRIEVYADTMYGAQKTAAKHFNAKKEWEVNVSLAEVDGKPYMQSTAFAKGGQAKKIDYLRDAKELSEKERFELKVLQALGGFNNGLNINGLYESIGFSNYRFNQYATESQTKKVQKALSSLIKKEYVDESGLGYKITQKGANYKREFNFRTYAKGGSVGDNLYVDQLANMSGARAVAVKEWVSANDLSKDDLLNIIQGLGRKQITASQLVDAVLGNKTATSEVVSYAKEGKGFKMAKGGETTIPLQVIIDGDWDTPKFFKTMSLAKKYVMENTKKHDFEIVDSYGDTIFVEKGSSKEDFDFLFSDTKYAKGGMIEHGLRAGDKIIGGKIIGTTIRVRNDNFDEDARVDLNTGKRTLIIYDKKSKKWVEKMAQGGTTKRIKRMGC